MSLLSKIHSPRDLRPLSREQLDQLATEIRAFLVAEVSRTGGHLGPNLGVVELTIALHRVFDSPRDTVVFDTGHQAYVHKLLTGRQDFTGLRRRGGLAGYPSRAESVHDVVENSHASTSLSWAAGIARGRRLLDQGERHTVAVVGDGALTGGMAWEALNNIATDTGGRLVVVVNDNGRSYAPTVGGMARLLPGLFPDRVEYVGPIDGHDVEAMENALARAKAHDGPVIVHAITRKGHGFLAAENHEADRFHAIGVIDPDTGHPVTVPGAAAAGPTWTSVFSDALALAGRRRRDVVALTAAMLVPTGLDRFAAQDGDRVIDVGIAEQHATAAAAGLAFAGAHPVVAVYSTFLSRAFDQVLMDVALHRAGVTFVLDRAGVTGEDGPSHHGVWDLSLLAPVPHLLLAAPRDAARLSEELHEALDVADAPTVVRFPKGVVGPDLPALVRLGEGLGAVDVLARGRRPDVLIVTVGPMAGIGLDAARRLAAQGIDATVVDPRWVLPVPEAVLQLAADHRIVVTVEDGVRTGGVGAQVALAVADAGLPVPVHVVGLPREFLAHGARATILADTGITAADVARASAGWIAAADLTRSLSGAFPLPGADHGHLVGGDQQGSG